MYYNIYIIMINKENMKKPQRDLFDFLENIIKKKYNDLVLECFLKFKNKTVFEKTMKRILKGKDEFECDEYKINLEQLEFIIAELQKLKKKKKKKSPIKKTTKKIPEDECPICYKTPPLSNPMQTECGHIFCKKCIHLALEKNLNCPMCRKKCDMKKLKKLPTAKERKEKQEKEDKKEKERKEKQEKEDKKEKENKCKICLESISKKEKKEIPCGHIFHKDCIKRWGQIGNKKCPICKKDIRKNKEKKEKKEKEKKNKGKKNKGKKVGEDCTKDEECKGKGCCDKGKCEKGNKKVCKNKDLLQKFMKIPPKKKSPVTRDYYDENECKTEDDCPSKCCKDNQCVDDSVCKREKGKQKMIEDQEEYDSAKKKETKLIKKYQKFEMKAIAAMKNLADKVDKPLQKHSKLEHSLRLLSLYRKALKKILKHYNENYGGEKAGKVEWEWDEIPKEIQKHIDFAKERIFDITSSTPISDKSRERNEKLAELETNIINKEYNKIIKNGIIKQENIINVAEDGNCLFNSIVGFLHYEINKKKLSKKEEGKLAKELREKMTSWMLKNKNIKIKKLDMTLENYIQEMEINDENRNIPDSIQNFKQYLKWIGKNNQWGGQGEITVLAMKFKRSIIIFDRNHKPLVNLGHIIPNSDPIILYYRGTVSDGDHYQYYGENHEENNDSDSEEEKEQTFSEEEIQQKSKSKTPPKSKSKTPPKSKSPKKSHKKILDDLKNNKLNQEDMDNILKNLNLKTQKEYLKELIIIGLNKM